MDRGLEKPERAGLRAQKTMMTSKGFVFIVCCYFSSQNEERRNAGFLDRQSIYVKQNV